MRLCPAADQRYLCVCVCVCVSVFEPPARWQRTAFASWKYTHYFQFASEKDKNNIMVKCALCVGEKPLSTAKNSTSHLKKQKRPDD